MKIYDISLLISPELPVWPGDPQITLELVESMDAGAHANVSRFSASVHSGTHVDAPHHFLNDGRTVETLSLDTLTGPCYVVEFGDDVTAITYQILSSASIPPRTTRLLIHTSNSTQWAREEKTFFAGFVGVTEDGADWLVKHEIRLVGVDYLSVAPYKKSLPTHRTLLSAGIVVLEGLNLTCVPQGNYILYCLPLKLVGSDGAPARTILVG